MNEKKRYYLNSNSYFSRDRMKKVWLSNLLKIICEHTKCLKLICSLQIISPLSHLSFEPIKSVVCVTYNDRCNKMKVLFSYFLNLLDLTKNKFYHNSRKESCSWLGQNCKKYSTIRHTVNQHSCIIYAVYMKACTHQYRMSKLPESFSGEHV